MEGNSESVGAGNAPLNVSKVTDNLTAKQESIEANPIDNVCKLESPSIESPASNVDQNAPISTTQSPQAPTPTKPINKVYRQSPKKLEKQQQKSLLKDISSPRKAQLTLPTKSNEVVQTFDPLPVEDFNEPLSPITIIDNLMEESISMYSNLQNIDNSSTQELGTPEKVSNLMESVNLEGANLKEPLTLESENVLSLKKSLPSESLASSPEKVCSLKKPLIAEPEQVSSLKKSLPSSPEKLSSLKKPPIVEPEQVSSLKKSPASSPEKFSSLKESPALESEKDSSVEEPLTVEPEQVPSLKKSLTSSPERFSSLKEPPALESEKDSSLKELVTLDTGNFSNLKEPLTLEPEKVFSLKEPLTLEPEKLKKPLTMSPVKVFSLNKTTHLEPEKIYKLKDPLALDLEKDSSLKEPVTLESGKVSSVKEPVNIELELCPTSYMRSTESPVTVLIFDTESETSKDTDSNAKQSISSENTMDSIEKEPSKRIAREMKSLLASAKESKIINECTQLKTKVRKSRNCDSTNTSLNNSECDKISSRRGSTGSHISTCSEKSEKPTKVMKRSMRSQNPDFVSKQKQFLNSVTGKQGDVSMDGESGDETKMEKSFEGKSSEPKSLKKKRHFKNIAGLKSDIYCWRCHWCFDADPIDKGPVHCAVCPRSYHYKCLTSNERNKSSPEESWACPECVTIVAVESSTNRPPAMSKASLLSDLLQYAWAAMCEINGVEPFMSPVDRKAFPHYDDYVVHPMDLSVVKDNIIAGIYKSTEAFLGDIQWIQHNSIIFNTVHSKLSAAAKALVRACRLEIGELEACPECYAGAHARQTTWFTDVCSNPHILLWAKLKGFPYWPAKGMSVNSQGLVNVRFFGAHDRAWVSSKDCYLYSIQDPNGFRTKRPDILQSVEEAEFHIRNIAKKFGSFKHAWFKTPLDVANLNNQIKEMIPLYQNDSKGELKKDDTPTTLSPGRKKLKRRSLSKSSTSKLDSTATEDVAPPVLKKKVADETEISNENKEKSIANAPTKEKETKEKENKEQEPKEKAKKVKVKKEQGNKEQEKKEKEKKEQENKEQETKEKEAKEKETKEVSRKRRRSILEEATLTILESKSSKRKRIGSSDNVQVEKAKATSTPIKQKKSKDAANVCDGDVETEIPKIIVNRTTLKIIKQRNKAPNAKADNTPTTSTTTADDPTPNSAKKETPKNDKLDVQTWFSQKTKDTGVKLRSKPKQYRVSPKINKKENEKAAKKVSEDNASTSATTSKEQDKLQTGNTKKKTVEGGTLLSILARQRHQIQVPNFPTISDVRSLSSPASSTSSKDNGPTDITVPDKPLTPKSPPIRTEGRVGVRSFARMTSPPKETPNTRPQRGNKDNTVVHIKTEPIDAEEQPEKIDFWKSIHLRPTKTAQPVIPTGPPPLKVFKSNVSAAKVPVDIAPRAKKSFPLPKKAGEDKDLNRKDSMVYIPVQPPVTNAPIRPAPAKQTPVRINGPISTPVTVGRLAKPITTSAPTSMVNPLPSTVVSLPTVVSSSISNNTVSTPTIAPATVRTVPLITTVNGQWTLALQPMMSVGNLDMNPIGPMVNGVTNRPLAPATVSSTYVNSIMVNSTTEPNTHSELPRLQQRPLMNPFDPSTQIGDVPVPSAAGQLSAKINQNAVKLADFFRTLLEDSIEKLDGPAEQATHLKLQIEQMRWKHQQELQELKHNHELMLLEIRSSIEKDKSRIIRETRRTCQVEQEIAVSQAKSKQWCANCRQEAQFYCCWNTSYCDYSCQNAHWMKHSPVCTQKKTKDNNGKDRRINQMDKRLQLFDKAGSSFVTVGGKTVARSINQCPTSQSLLVNMGDDHNNQAPVKCLAYTPSSTMLINNQMNSTDDAAGTVVVSSGYLVVGNTSPTKQTVSLK